MARWQRGLSQLVKLGAAIIINEAYPHPLENEEEWLELYNRSEEAVDLSGYFLDDKEGGTSPYHIPQGEIIEPKGYRVFEKGTTGIGLNDTGDDVRLLDPQELVVDLVVFPGIEAGRSYARVSENSDDWQVSEPTKNATNDKDPQVTVKPTVNLKILKISEVYACPKDSTETEWVEIFNPSTNPIETTVKLIDGGGREKMINLNIPAQGWESVDLMSGWLNNSGDEVSLSDLNNQVIDHMSYDECIKNTSWSLIGNQFVLTTKITRNSANVWEKPTTPTAMPISPTQTLTSQPANTPSLTPHITEVVTTTTQTINERNTILGTMSAETVATQATKSTITAAASITRQTGRYWLMAGFLLLTGGFWGDIMKRRDV